MLSIFTIHRRHSQGVLIRRNTRHRVIARDSQTTAVAKNRGNRRSTNRRTTVVAINSDGQHGRARIAVAICQGVFKAVRQRRVFGIQFQYRRIVIVERVAVTAIRTHRQSSIDAGDGGVFGATDSIRPDHTAQPIRTKRIGRAVTGVFIRAARTSNDIAVSRQSTSHSDGILIITHRRHVIDNLDNNRRRRRAGRTIADRECESLQLGYVWHVNSWRSQCVLILRNSSSRVIGSYHQRATDAKNDAANQVGNRNGSAVIDGHGLNISETVGVRYGKRPRHDSSYWRCTRG